MPDYTDFFLGSRRSVVKLETLEISHASFSQTYRVVRNAINGITATDENGLTRSYQYYPLKITRNSLKDDLDASIKVTLGDLGDITGPEIAAIANAGTWTTRPIVKYRVYRSDDLSSPMDGPYVYEIASLSVTASGCSFEAKAPDMSLTASGLLYKMTDFPMLNGFV